MIKKEELQFTKNNGMYVPFPGVDYAYDAINRLSYALAVFKKNYENKEFNVLLSNGEDLVFKIEDKNLAHLFGIDYRRIVANKEFLCDILEFDEKEAINSYTLINRIIDNADKVIEHDEQGINLILNYYNIMIRTTLFIKMPTFDKFRFGVINFNRYKYENCFEKKFYPKSNKFLLIPTDEELVQFCLIGLNRYNNSNALYPETFMLPSNFQNYLYKQELLMPEEILIHDVYDYERINATNENKRNILNLYKSLISMYNTRSRIKTKTK